MKFQLRTLTIVFLTFLMTSSCLFAIDPSSFIAKADSPMTYSSSADYTRWNDGVIHYLHIQTGSVNDLIYAGVFSEHGSTVSSIWSSNGLQWIKRASYNFYINTPNVESRSLEIWYAICPSSTDFDMKITLSNPAEGDASAFVYRITGENPTAPFETSNPVTASGYGSTMDSPITTHTQNALSIGFIGVVDSTFNFVTGDFTQSYEENDVSNTLIAASTTTPNPANINLHCYWNAGTHYWGAIVDTITSAPSPAAQTQSLQGTIYDYTTNAPIAGASVTVNHKDGSLEDLTTDANGKYTTTYVYPNDLPLSIDASATNHFTETVNDISTTSAQTITQDFHLHSQPSSLALDNYDTGYSFEVYQGVSIPLSFSTTQPNDLIYLAVSSPGSRTVTGITSTPSLTWTQRKAVSYGSGSENLGTWYAVKPQAGLLTITVSMSGINAKAVALAFGISGADTSNPFDVNPSSNTGLSTSPNTQISTNAPNDFVIGIMSSQSTMGQSLGIGFNNIWEAYYSEYVGDIYTGLREVLGEYKIAYSPLNNANVGATIGEVKGWAMIADAVRQGGEQQYTLIGHVYDQNTANSLPLATVTVQHWNVAQGVYEDKITLPYDPATGFQTTYFSSQIPLKLKVAAPGYDEQIFNIGVPNDGSAYYADLQMVPSQLCTFTVKVTDKNNAPINNANIDIGSLPDWWMYNQKTDSAGTYTYTFWVSDFPLTLEISKPNFVSQEVVVANPTGAPTLTSYITMDTTPPPTYQLSGTITDGSTNQPISAGQVTLDFGESQPTQTLNTDGNGKYHITYSYYPPTTSVTVTASKDGYTTYESNFNLQAQDYVIDAPIYALDYQWTQTFHVVDASSYNPVTYTYDRTVPYATITIAPNNGPVTRTYTTNANGEIVLTFSASELPVFINATAPGYQEPSFPWGVDWHFEPYPPNAGANTYIAIMPIPTTTAPKVTLDPQSGPSGTDVTAHGINFAGNEVVFLNWDNTGNGMIFTTNADGTFDTTFNVDAAVGTYTLYFTSDNPQIGNAAQTTFTVTASPTITVTPSSGMKGTSFVVSGTDFFRAHDEETVFINFDGSFIGLAYEDGVSGNLGSWSSSALTIPFTASVGVHTITATDVAGLSASATFTVTAPTTTISLTPNSGPRGSSFVISGTDFSKTNYEVSVTLTFDGSFLGFAYVGGLAVNDGSWRSVAFTVPMSASEGTHTITATDENGFTASSTFTVTAPLTAISVSPSSGPIDTIFSVSGHDFAKSIDEESVTITFDGSWIGFAYEGGTSSFADSGSWSSDDFRVPLTASIGTHTITATDVAGFTASATFTVTAPLTAISLTPSSGMIGTLFTVSGYDFFKSTDEESVNIKFDGSHIAFAYEGGTGLLANSGSWNSEVISVPLSASVGVHTITATDVTGFTASATFTVTAPTTAITLNPSSGPKDSIFTVSGRDFGKSANEMSVLITFDGSFLGLAYEGGMGSLADSGYWSSSDLQVPLAASLGPHTITATDALGFTASATFTVTAPLTAISVNPSSGPADSLIRISGHDFSKSIDEESVTITFDGSLLGFAYEGGTGSLANSGSWSSGDLYVPKTATVGTHTITATDAVGFTATATFTVTEPLTAISVSPSSGPIGSLISVSGHDFAKSIDEETVIINLDGLRLGLAYEGGTGSLANSGSWSSANLQVPLTASVGIHTITATDWAGFTATTTFTVTAPTSKITLTPSSGLANSQFKVSGTDFYQSINEISLTIKFDGKFLAFAYEGGVGLNNLGTWTSLNLNIPSDASIGPHTVTATDEAGFTATATFTVTAPTISTTIVTTLDHSATVDQLRQTGIQVQITGATLTDGTSITVSTANFDTAQPAGTGTPFGQRPTFYDTQVTLTDGQPIGGDVMVLVTIQSSGITSGDLIYYWNGANWIPAAGQSHDEAGSVSGMIPASALTGTPIMVTDQTIMVTPEYPLGALIAIAACFAAFITFKKRSSLHKSHPN